MTDQEILSDWFNNHRPQHMTDDQIRVYNDWIEFAKHYHQVKNCDLSDVGGSLPTKDEVYAEGYRIANDVGYNYRRVLKEPDHDIYYSGWMDCFDWISKGNER